MALISNFQKAKDTYRKHAVVQAKMAKKLISEISLNIQNNFDVIFEIGSGTGLLTDEIAENLKYNHLLLNDITENFTHIKPDRYYQGNILDTKIEDKNIDLVLSSAVFQWIKDKEKLFLKLSSIIKDGGILAFTTFGCKNFNQIKDITGFGLNYESPENIEDKLNGASFKILYFEEELETLYFEDVKKILEHIKYTGVGTGAGYFWTKQKYEIFKDKYLKNFSDKNGVELTYHPVYFICKKD